MFRFSATVKEKASMEQLQTLLKSPSCKQEGREGVSQAKLTQAAVPPPQEGKRVMEGWKEEKGLAQGVREQTGDTSLEHR